MRESLQDMLEINGYEITLAENGLKGLDAIQQQRPDLIISDVMMPEMDGFELLEKIREDTQTELIPVVMLTARVELESKLRGLELGADDYITKPFEFRELNLKISNLLRRREKLIHSSHTMPAKPSGMSQDAVFLKKLHLLLDELIEDPKLQMDAIASQLNMSLSTFNRRLKKVTGKAPNRYVKEYRLERSRQMIRLNYGNLSEVAFKTGFSSLSYFSSCYKEHFGTSPKADIPQ